MEFKLYKSVPMLKKCRNFFKNRQYKIGQYEITLPHGHKLDLYQSKYKNYDKKLPKIARLVEIKYGTMSIVDIGANVGDSAVAFRDACKAALICIEGNPIYFAILEANLSNIPGVVRLVKKFIGEELVEVVGKIISMDGTARIEREDVTRSSDFKQTTLNFTTYKEIADTNSDLPEIRLVKTDTDGFDFKIILGSIAEISKNLPILFIEFDPSFSPLNQKDEALIALNALILAGYRHYLIYDNFGNYLISFSESANERFSDLFCFLHQSRRFGGGVFYLDVCCFSDRDTDIFLQVVERERAGEFV
jgi:FkbM family methyltransferase